MSLFWTWTFFLQNFDFALRLLFVLQARALLSMVGTNASANMPFLAPMKYRSARKLSMHSAESIRKASPWEMAWFYLLWDNYLQNTTSFHSRNKLASFVEPSRIWGTAQWQRAPWLGRDRWKVLSLVLILVFTRIKNNCRGGYEAYLVFVCHCFSFDQMIEMSAVKGALDYPTHCLAGGLLDIWTGGKNETDQIGIIKNPAMCEGKNHHMKCDFWFPRPTTWAVRERGIYKY